MLTPEDIDPELKDGEDVVWMTDIRDTIKNKIILSARHIESQKKDVEDDPNFKSGFKHTGASKIKGETSILLRNSEGKINLNLGGTNLNCLGRIQKMRTHLCQVLMKMTQKFCQF